MLRSSKSSSRYFLLSYLHTSFIAVLLRELFSPKYAADLFADINLGIAVVYEVVKLGVILLFTLAFYTVLPTSTSFTSLEKAHSVNEN